jgi:hypothetical protein
VNAYLVIAFLAVTITRTTAQVNTSVQHAFSALVFDPAEMLLG